MTAPRGWLGAEAEAARLLLAELQEAGLDDESQQLSVESETNFLEAVERALAEVDETEALAEALAARIVAMQERVERLKAKRDRIRDLIATALETSGVKLPLRLPTATLSVSTRPGKLAITDEAAIPDKYWKVETIRTLDRRAVAAAIKDRAQVPGATPGNSTRVLTIRR